MKYRNFGRVDFKPSALGFGAMRLPILDGDPAKVNAPLAIEMIRYAIDHGVNYVDSAYGYHRGNSERVVGKALRDGYREKVRLATKLPCHLINKYEDFDKFLNEQLEKLQTNHIDFYLLHGLGEERWPRVRDLDVISWAKKKLDEGKIKHLGFSFHDELSLFKEIVDYYDWEFCQIHYNYMDRNYQAGTEGLRYAASKGMGVVIMEPIAGGRLAIEPPEGLRAIWREGHHRWKPAEWALQWVWDQPEVSIVLSGMSAMSQVVENVHAAGRSGVGKLTSEDHALLERVAAKFREIGYIGCTGCGYCQPCSSGVTIPAIFGLFNDYYLRNRDESVKARYKETILPEQSGKNCVRCGKCEELCPQHLPIRDLLRGATDTFER